jgi:hypothetical protein
VKSLSGHGIGLLQHHLPAERTSWRAKLRLSKRRREQLDQRLQAGSALPASRVVKMKAQSPDSPAELRRQVTSPNGTTAAALEVLMNAESGLSPLLTEAVAAAKNRAVALGTAH